MSHDRNNMLTRSRTRLQLPNKTVINESNTMPKEAFDTLWVSIDGSPGTMDAS